MSSEKDIHDYDLYKAATESIVADTAEESTFSKMLNSATETTDANDFYTTLAAVEATIKSEYGLSTMPNAWRSAKSVVKTAMQLGISLTDDNGVSRGKTELQNEIKNKRATAEKTEYEKAVAACSTLQKHWAKLSTSEQDEVQKFLVVITACPF